MNFRINQTQSSPSRKFFKVVFVILLSLMWMNLMGGKASAVCSAQLIDSSTFDGSHPGDIYATWAFGSDHDYTLHGPVDADITETCRIDSTVSGTGLTHLGRRANAAYLGPDFVGSGWYPRDNPSTQFNSRCLGVLPEIDPDGVQRISGCTYPSPSDRRTNIEVYQDDASRIDINGHLLWCHGIGIPAPILPEPLTGCKFDVYRRGWPGDGQTTPDYVAGSGVRDLPAKNLVAAGILTTDSSGRIDPFDVTFRTKNTHTGGYGAGVVVTFRYPYDPTIPPVPHTVTVQTNTFKVDSAGNFLGGVGGLVLETCNSVGNTTQRTNPSDPLGYVRFDIPLAENYCTEIISINGGSVTLPGFDGPFIRPWDDGYQITGFPACPGRFGPPWTGDCRPQKRYDWQVAGRFDGLRNVGGGVSAYDRQIDHGYDFVYVKRDVVASPASPFFHILGGDIYAGGELASDFLGQQCSGTSVVANIQGWEETTDPISRRARGALSQFAAFATSAISDFDTTGLTNLDVANRPAPSYFNSSSNTGLPSNQLKFGNADANHGSYPNTYCRSKLSALTPDATVTGNQNITALASSHNGQVVRWQGGPGVRSLAGGPIPPGKRLTLIVDGASLHIAGNITFPGSYTNRANTSSLLIVTTGSIHIDPAVTQLDGYYVAEGTAGSGIISTCATADSLTQPDITSAGGASQCQNTLTVNGLVAARQFYLRRTVSDPTIRAEIFRFNPLLYLAPPPMGRDAQDQFNRSQLEADLPPLF